MFLIEILKLIDLSDILADKIKSLYYQAAFRKQLYHMFIMDAYAGKLWSKSQTVKQQSSS